MIKCIYFLICLIPFVLHSQTMSDDSIAINLLQNYKRLEPQFYNKAMERLLFSINKDSVLKNAFLSGDSSLFKSLKFNLYPMLKLNPAAKNFTLDDNICKYFEFDTLNFDCQLSAILDNKKCFFLTRGYNECDELNRPLTPGEKLVWCKGEFIFKQYYYKSNFSDHCSTSWNFGITDQRNVFIVDGFDNFFIIFNNNLFVLEFEYNKNNSIFVPILQRIDGKFYGPNTVEYVRQIACDCPVGGKIPWWMFWK